MRATTSIEPQAVERGVIGGQLGGALPLGVPEVGVDDNDPVDDAGRAGMPHQLDEHRLTALAAGQVREDPPVPGEVGDLRGEAGELKLAAADHEGPSGRGGVQGESVPKGPLGGPVTGAFATLGGGVLAVVTG
ncbi:hypothetical protein [Streptomyces sp. M54]|uniref:hypothetical protein n=1 Tax=Streptomyces sp. M54 TaxID=2759525 RepID=UPI001FB0BC28|nr:hypothetical protein [Streptomyces sp. M54]